MAQQKSDVMIWVHGDCLNPQSPAIRAYPVAPRVFVFDDAVLAGYEISLKRIVFLYECLLEIEGIQIRRGDVIAELMAAAQESGCRRIVTVASVAPGFARLCTQLRRAEELSLEVLPADPFVRLSPDEEAQLDLRRFSRYWQKISPLALSGDEMPG